MSGVKGRPCPCVHNYAQFCRNPCSSVQHRVGNDTKLLYHLLMKSAQASPPKHRQVYQALSRQIQSGRLKRGDRLPSEAELVRTFGASRITVGRAVRDLQSQGLVERRAGSGTYVSRQDAPGALSFGLLIPDLGETDIFEPVCQGMMASPLARNHALLWGSVSGEASRKRIARGSCAVSTSSGASPGSSLRRWSSPHPVTTSIIGLRRRSTMRVFRWCCSTGT